MNRYLLPRMALFAVLIGLPLEARAAGYVVQPGDTLYGIAEREHVALSTLVGLNGLANVNLIRVGQVLQLPGLAGSGAATGSGVGYRVRWGDTLSAVAARYGTTVASIRALNPRLGSYLLAGQWLTICGNCSTAPAATSAAAGGAAAQYAVRTGDTLLAIAVRFGTTVSALQATNHLTNPNVVPVGTLLTVPGGASAAPATAAGTAPANLNAGSIRALIVQEAQQYGVDPSLALAVSWQESGFNQTLVSPTGAIGAMQVEPYTGDHIARLLGRPVNLSLVNDNVLAGVYWLATLVRYYGGDERLAAAAYYQGTRAIAQHGLYSDTQQYVANVLALRARF